MARFTRQVTCLLTVLLAVASPAVGQTANDPCGSPAGGFNFWVQYRLCNIARSAPKETHVEAPSSLPGSTALVEKAGHPDIVSLALGLVGAPTAGCVGCSQCGDVLRTAIDHRNPVQVAAIFWSQGADKRRPPAGRETMVGVKRAETTEASVDRPQLVIAIPG